MGRKSRNAGKKKTKVQPEKVATEFSEIDRAVRNVVVRDKWIGYKVGYDPNKCNQQDIERIKLYYTLRCPITTNLENFWIGDNIILNR